MLAGGGLLVVSTLQDTEDVTLRFLFRGSTRPLRLSTAVDAARGAIAWIGPGMLHRHRRRVARRD